MDSFLFTFTEKKNILEFVVEQLVKSNGQRATSKK